MGIAHNGSMEVAKKMIERCKSVGADAVKFQMFSIEDYSDPEIKKCWLSKKDMKELKEYADSISIEWFCTPEKVWHIETLKNIGVKRLKVNNKMCDDEEFLKAIRATNLPVFISVPPDKLKTTWPIIEKLWISDDNAPKCDLLYCIPKYPPEINEIKLASADDVYTGFSNHYPDPFVPIVALAMGYEIIEVHVKLDNWHICPDQKVSIDMPGLLEIVKAKEMLEEML